MKISSFLVAFVSFQAMGQRPAVIAEYIANYQQYAIAEQVRTGIPAAITMAQGIHESGAGLGDLATKSNNHFGIKCKSDWTGDKIYHDDDEQGECFRAYACVADSYRDHSDFLKNGKRYSFLFDLDPQDYAAWANGLKQAGYATNPQYPKILVRLIEENNLESLTETAIVQAGTPQDVWITTASRSAGSETERPVFLPISISPTEKKNRPVETAEAVSPAPQGIFRINHCRVLLAVSGTSLKALAAQQGIRYADLLKYNDMKPVDRLVSNQLIFLEEKRKKGNNKTHEVQKGESAWMISQQEGMRLDKLLEYNRLTAGSKLKTGQVLHLKGKAPK